MDVNELLEYLNLGSDIKDMDGLKAKFNERYALKSEVVDPEKVKSQVTGQVTGAMNNALKKMLGLSSEEIEGKKWEDILALGIGKKEKEIEDLKLTVTQTGETQVKELTDKLTKANDSIKQYKELAEKTGKEYETFRAEAEATRKNDKIGFIFTDSFGKLGSKLVEMDDLKRRGFEAEIKENISIDFNENNEIIVKDKSGNRYQNPNKAGSFMGPEEAMEFLASKLGVLKKNGAQQTTVKTQTQTSTQTNNGVRQVHPNAM